MTRDRILNARPIRRQESAPAAIMVVLAVLLLAGVVYRLVDCWVRW